MKAKSKRLKYFLIAVFMALGALFVLKFGLPQLLRSYIKSGIGDCEKIPVFCKAPSRSIATFTVDSEYAATLIPHNFPILEAAMPKGFNVVQDEISKVYYKRKKRQGSSPTIYMLIRKGGFFIGLFPHLKKTGVTDDYEFLKRTMNARVEEIKNINDAFFVIMKGIFVPDLGDQSTAVMLEFSIKDKRGFLNYNLGPSENYFDCNVFDREGNYYKIYIKDKKARLSLDNVLTIVSTLGKKAGVDLLLTQ